MGLPPLEYIDCFLDSPNFREIISLYEKELEDNAHHVKALVRECKHMIQATEEFSKVQSSFAQVLSQFKFQTIGEQTEDERMIANSLQNFSRLLFDIEACRHNMLSTISVRLLQTLERFRKDHIQKAKDEKKRFDRSSHNYYEALQKHLGVSPRKKDIMLTEADSSMEREHAFYRQAAFDYVCKLQDVHAQKQYELIEPIIGYISDVSTFLHQAYDYAGSIKPELQAVQFKVQILRDTHINEQEKAYQLKAQVIEEGEAGLVHHPEFLRQGNLFVQDNLKKVQIGTQWHRYFCQFRKKEIAGKKIRQVRFLPLGHQGNYLPTTDFMEVKDCVRSKTEDVDRRFCFDLELQSLHGSHKYTVQAVSSDNRKGWLEIMEGKEPLYSALKVMESGVNDNGIAFVQKCIDTIESRGLDEEGLYRKPGVISKASKLVKECIDKGRIDSINLADELEWDTKTVASAVKMYLSKHLGEPLFTFTLHQQFIDSAKIPDHEKRVCSIRELCDQLPPNHRRLTAVIMWHLSRVAAQSDVNLMKASNIGVCFGPTLMRPERESVATIVDIKYQNIIVEVMVENVEEIFSSDSGSITPKGPKTDPPAIPPPPAPAHPSPLTKKPQGNDLLDSAGYHVPQQIISPSSAPSSRGGRSSIGGTPRPTPPVPLSRNPSTVSTSSKGRSPSPEPYEIPLRMHPDGDKRRPPPNPPNTSGPPPLPKYKPQLPESKKRSFTAVSQAPSEANHRSPVGFKRFSQFEAHTKPVDNSPPPQPPVRAKKSRSARALYDCQAEDELELSFKKDDILYNVTPSEEPDWLQASRGDGKQGLVPANYLEIL